MRQEQLNIAAVLFATDVETAKIVFAGRTFTGRAMQILAAHPTESLYTELST